MKPNFPKITKSQQMGQIGVDLVSAKVHHELEWIFRKNHNEHDFGIDGYIDIVTTSGDVTGSCLAVQIKCGHSFFKTKTEDGVTYYGENKHLNYLINHPVPVIIILCDPQTNNCIWELFEPEKTEPTKTGWKLAMPEDKFFSKIAISELESIAGPSHDYTEDLNQYWAENDLFDNIAGAIYYIVGREDIESNYFENVEDFFKRLMRKKGTARKYQGRVEFGIHGYDIDPRELFEIPEVVSFIKKIEPIVKYWFFFLSTHNKASGLKMITACISDAKIVTTDINNRKVFIQFDKEKLVDFMERNFCWLNEMTDLLNISLEENKRVSNEINELFAGQMV